MSANEGLSPEDRREAGRFAREMIRRYGDAMVSILIDLGDRVGLLEAAAQGPGTSGAIAKRAGLAERPVREWLSAMAAASILEYDAATRTFSIRPERAICLTGDSPLNVAAASRFVAFGTKNLAEIARSFSDGEGVPPDRFLPEATDLFADLSRRRYDAAFVDRYLPRAAGLVGRLREGARALDLGCGSGQVVRILARSFPRSTFLGIDRSVDAIATAERETRAEGLDNVEFRVGEASRASGAFDLVLALDAIHDQGDPEGFLRAAHRTLVPGGIFLAVEPAASSRLEENLGRPETPYLYGLSVLYCLPVGLSAGTAGLGTCWGESAAREMLDRVGFVEIESGPAPLNSMATLWLARRSGQRADPGGPATDPAAGDYRVTGSQGRG
ncbi:MAG: methyltransferase domain-containing protein [Thermoplasmata archaeon]